MTRESTPALHGYGIREVAELLDTSPTHVRGWVRAGFVTPARGRRGALRFSFQDLAFLRRVRELEARRVAPRRVRRVVERLRESSGAPRLAGVDLPASRGEVVLRDGEALFSAESGQCVFDFEARPRTAAVLRLPTRPDRAGAAEDCYRLGRRLEQGDLEAAREAYRRALALDPEHVDAHIDLGCLEHEQGRLAEAEAHYRAAVALRPRDAIACFNLAVVLDDEARDDEARDAYEAALSADPACAEAHYNLAKLCERAGDRAGAVRHLTAYKRLLG